MEDQGIVIGLHNTEFCHPFGGFEVLDLGIMIPGRHQHRRIPSFMRALHSRMSGDTQ